MAERDAVWPRDPHALYREHGYSPAVRSDGLLFISGQVGARADGSPEPDAEAQVRLAFENLRGVLEAAGLTFDDVIDTMLLSTDPDTMFPIALRIAPDIWGSGPPPTLTGVGVTWLAGFRFEIKAVAALRRG